MLERSVSFTSRLLRHHHRMIRVFLQTQTQTTAGLSKFDHKKSEMAVLARIKGLTIWKMNVMGTTPYRRSVFEGIS